MDRSKPIFVLLAMMALLTAVNATDPGAAINDSLMLFVGALPIIVLAITSIVSIILALVSVIIVVLLITWFKDILMLPLDIVKGTISGMK